MLEALNELGETEAMGDLGGRRWSGGVGGFGRRHRVFERQALERRCRGIWEAQGTTPAVERWEQLWERWEPGVGVEQAGEVWGGGGAGSMRSG